MTASYDPQKRQMKLPRDATLYDHYHEMAHQVQHRVRCMPFRCWMRFNGIRLLGYLSVVWVEFDAMRRTQSALEWVDSWTPEVKKEGWTKFMTYIKQEPLS